MEKTAEKLRDLVLTLDEELNSYDKQVKGRCCNLALLESVYTNYAKKSSNNEKE